MKTWAIGPVGGDEGQFRAAHGKPAFRIGAAGVGERTESIDEGKIMVCRLGVNGCAGVKLNEGERYSDRDRC